MFEASTSADVVNDRSLDKFKVSKNKYIKNLFNIILIRRFRIKLSPLQANLEINVKVCFWFFTQPLNKGEKMKFLDNIDIRIFLTDYVSKLLFLHSHHG